jgi:hypothetical protein
MAEAFDRFDALKLPPELAARTRFCAEANREVVGSIRLGVLFVMAFWSVPARQAFVELKRVLEAVDSQRRLELVVADIDGCRQLAELPEIAGMPSGGWGEAAWICQGRIVRTSGLGFHPECFESYTRQLLEDCAV